MSSVTSHPSGQVLVASSRYAAGAAGQHGLGGLERGAEDLGEFDPGRHDELHPVGHDIPVDSDPLAPLSETLSPEIKIIAFSFLKTATRANVRP